MAELSPLETQMPETSSLEASRASLIAQQQRLMDELEQRSKPKPLDFWSTLAGAAANSGNWGSQTIAALGAGAGAADQRQEAKELTAAQMRAEVARSQYGMEQERGMYNALRGLLSGGSGATGSARSLGLSPSDMSVLDSLPPSDRQALIAQAMSGKMEDMKEVLKTIRGMVAEKAKVPDAVKTLNNSISALPNNLQDDARKTAAVAAVYGNQRDNIKALTDLSASFIKGDIDENSFLRNSANLRRFINPESASTPASTPAPTIVPKAAPRAPSAGAPAITVERELDALRILEEELQSNPRDTDLPRLIDAQKKRIASMQNTTGATASARPDLPIAAKRELETDRIKKQQDADIARQAEMEKAWSTGAETANRDRQNAELTYKLVKENPSGFGLLNKPGWDKALAYLAEQGLRVGPYNVSIADIQGAMLRAGGYSQEDIDSVTKVQQLAIQTQLALASQAKGSVSNYEDRLFQSAGISISDSPKVIQYKTQLVIARSEAVQKIWSEWQRFKKTGGNIDDFRSSDQYKSIQDKYEKNLDATFKAYK